MTLRNLGGYNVGIGFVARGQVAVGVIAMGTVAVGVVAMGGVAIGVVALGGVTIGAFAAGAVAVGVRAVGAITVDLAHWLQGLAGSFAIAAAGRACPRVRKEGIHGPGRRLEDQ